jgi:hypothetical protein
MAKPCLCPACAPIPSPTYTEAYRLACEARFVANLPSDQERAKYLGKVSAARGARTAQELRTATWLEIKSRLRGNTSATGT